MYVFLKMKLSFIIVLLLFLSDLGFSQNVTIPDSIFKKYLVNHKGINTNNDTEIQLSEANNFVGTIHVGGKKIKDLTGIEAFLLIDTLICQVNDLTVLDVTKNTKLKYLDYSNNKLTSVDLSQNINLIKLWCYGNDLTVLDVTKNINLEFIECGNNELLSLNISSLLKLTALLCYNNKIVSLDGSNNSDLTYLNCKNNELTSLNLQNGNNLSIAHLDARENSKLSCIKVDEVSWCTENLKNIDPQTSFCLLTFLVDKDQLFLNIFPNPMSDYVSIETESPISIVSIMNTKGQLIKVYKIKPSTKLEMNLEELKVGVYFLKIELEEEVLLRKIIKH